MTQLEYIKIKLEELSLKFPNVVFSYGIDSMASCHLVEVTPLSEFYTNRGLMQNWTDFCFEFEEKYENEEILFIPTDSTLKLDEVLFSVENRKQVDDIYTTFLNSTQLSYFHFDNFNLTKISPRRTSLDINTSSFGGAHTFIQKDNSEPYLMAA